VSGTVRATSAREAVVDLQRRALFVTSVGRTNAGRSAVFPGRKQSVGLTFFRAFAVLVRAGVPIRRALLVSATHCRDRGFRETLHAVVAEIESGSSLSGALAKRPREFSSVQTAMIGAGEAGGVLDAVLDRIAEMLEREHSLSKRIQTALLYPSIVAAGAAVLIGFLILHVVPMFASMFARFGAPLPWPTRMLLEASAAATSPLMLVVLGAGVLCACAAAMSVRLRAASIERMRLRVPFAGTLARYVIVGRIARILGLLLRSGVPILSAIEVLVPVAGSRAYENGLASVGDALRRGEGIHASLERCALFDSLTLALVGAGEESGALDAMLLAAANYLDVEVEAMLTTLAALIEPILIGFLGLVVGFIVFSIFLPLYGLIGSIA
jgi:type IV pilus assembly protein PilC